MRSHGAVFVEDFAKHPNGGIAREAREVNDALRVARALEHASLARSDGEDMPGAAQIAWLGGRIGKGRGWSRRGP